MSTAVAKVEDHPPQPLSAVVRGMEKQFKLALPEHVSPERFVRVVVTAIQSNADLQQADRDSVLGAALKCAQDGLLPDGREAALVVYNTKVKDPDTGREVYVRKAQYLPMIAGVLAKVRRSGELLTISSHIVYEKDTFTYVLGDDERIEHQPCLSGPRGKPIAAYAVAKTKDGGIYREVMSVDQIEKVRNVSRAKDSGPWKSWWDEMARKTVMRRLAKRLPMSTDLAEVFQRDDDHYDISAADRAPAKPQVRRLHAGFDEPEAPQEPQEGPQVIEGEFTEAQGETGVSGDPEGSAEASDPPEAFSVEAWAHDLLKAVPEITDVEAMRSRWDAHKDDLKAANQALWRAVNKAVAERAQAIGEAAR